MTAWLVHWRLALRIARRDALRARGRSALVLLMVGLPVLAIVGGDTLYRTAETSAVEQLPTTLGAADARIEGVARSQLWAVLRRRPRGASAPTEHERPRAGEGESGESVVARTRGGGHASMVELMTIIVKRRRRPASPRPGAGPGGRS
ncbi:MULTISPECIES: hypothetical protein [unclassified Modestobacter]